MPKKKEDKTDKSASDEKFQQLDISTKDVRTAAIMLDTPETSIVCKSCQAIQAYMEKSEQNCLEMHQLDIVPRLVTLMASPEKVINACSIICLAVMIPHLAVRRSLLKLPCIVPLLGMLKPEEELVILERAAYIVSQLAEEYTFKQQLEEAKVCPLLIGLLTHSDCDVVKSSVKGLSLLTCQCNSRRSVAEGNGFPNLLSLLNSEYAIIQELTLQTLQNCLQDGHCRELFKAADGLAKLTGFLSNKDWGDLHVLAVNVLSLCLLEKGGMEALHSSDCLQRLLEAISDSQISQMKTNATLALARAASDPTSQKVLHEQEAEKVFIGLLASPDEALLCASCQALTALSSLTSSRQYVGREGGIKALVQLLQHTSGDVRSAAVQALSNEITEAPANANLISEAGGIEHIVSLLSDDMAMTRVYAISCVISMSPNAYLRSELIEQGVMNGLVGCLSHVDTNIQQICLEAIALLMVESSAREQYPVEEVQQLLQLLVSSNVEVSRCAAWALSGLAQSKQIADSIFKNKGLETLKRLTLSTHQLIQKYSSLALDRLLTGCPSAQYHMTGHLSCLSLIAPGTEFWDMGMAESAKGFVPLEELLADPPVLNRPILTVSLINQPTSVSSEDGGSDIGREGSGLEINSGATVKSRSGANSRIKKTKSEKSTVLTEEQGEGLDVQPHPPEGLLLPDPGLWEHITHVQRQIQPLASLQDQAERLAMYVSQVMGGAVGRSTNLQYELPIADTQSTNSTCLVPLGTVAKGSFQHRSLLYKVLADCIGLPCTLSRGDYGRHWNTVVVNKGEWLVDLMYKPGQLLDNQEAVIYKSL